MGASYRDCLALFQELAGDLDQLSALAQRKAEVVRQDDLIGLDEVLKQEQVLSLALRGLEQRRVKLLRELGLEGVPLDRVPDKAPPELEDEARRTVDGLRRSYQEYRSYAGMARNTLELSLHQIEKVVAAAGVDPADLGAGYEVPGVEPPKNMKTDFRA